MSDILTMPEPCLQEQENAVIGEKYKSAKNQTAEVLKAMLGGGGQSGVDYDAQPMAELSWYYTEAKDGKPGSAEPSVTLNVFPWLLQRVVYDEEVDKAFDEFAELPEHEDSHWLTIAEDFPQWYAQKLSEEQWEEEGVNPYPLEVGGLYGEGNAFTHNTYNGEDLLSDTLQFHYFTIDGESYVLLQIHGGGDVRGNYGRPRAFRTEEDIFDNARAVVGCEGVEHLWDTDDGYHWYHDGGTLGVELQNYPAFGEADVAGLDETDETVKLGVWQLREICKRNPHLKVRYVAQWKKRERELQQERAALIKAEGYKRRQNGGAIFIDADENGHCPLCGGKLEAWA